MERAVEGFDDKGRRNLRDDRALEAEAIVEGVEFARLYASRGEQKEARFGRVEASTNRFDRLLKGFSERLGIARKREIRVDFPRREGIGRVRLEAFEERSKIGSVDSREGLRDHARTFESCKGASRAEKLLRVDEGKDALAITRERTQRVVERVG